MSSNHQYTEVPSHLLKPGDIILFHSHGFFARLIQFYTNSYYNHTAIVSRIFMDDEVGIIESGGHGVQPGLLRESWKSDKLILRPKDYTEVKGVKAVQMAHILGKQRYDYLQIVKFLFKHTFGRKYSKNAKLICSELVAEAWSSTGLDLFPEKSAPSPASIAALRHIKLDVIWGPDVG